MKPELKRLFSADVDDLETWQPDSVEAVYVGLELEIGMPNRPGMDLFQIVIATPEALRAREHLGFCFPGRHYLIVRRYDWNRILLKINELIAECEGADWNESSQRLARYFFWEFEDYVEEDEADAQT